MHNGLIRSEGEKMSKSIGNIILLREMLARSDPEVVRTYLLSTHYRSPLEFSTDKLDEAKAAYGRFASALADIDFRVANAGKAAERGECPDLTLRAEAARVAFARAHGRRPQHGRRDRASSSVWSARCIATSRRWTAVRARSTRRRSPPSATCVRESLGVLLIPAPGAGASLTGVGSVAGDDAAACVTGGVALLPAARLAEEGRWDDVALVYADRLGCDDASYACVLRDHYRAEKQWADADRLRGEIQATGFEVRDTPQGTQVVKK